MGLCNSSFENLNRPSLRDWNYVMGELKIQREQIRTLTRRKTKTISHQFHHYTSEEANLVDLNKELQRSLSHSSSYKLQSMLKGMVRSLHNNYLIRVHKYFFRWKISESDPFSSMHYMQSKMNSDNRRILRENSLKVHYDELKPKEEERSFRMTNLFKFFEDLLDKKFEADTIDSYKNRELKPLPDFTVEYVNRTYGLKKMAKYNLREVLKGLKSHYTQGNEYAEMMCRLLQVFHPQPVSPSLVPYLVKVRVEFNRLTALCNKAERKAYAVDVFNLVYSLFEKDKGTRNTVISFLRPKNMNEEEYLLFWVSYKMVRAGIAADSFYNLLDKNQTGEVDHISFVKGLKKHLESSKIDTSLIKKAFSFPLTRDKLVNSVKNNVFYDNCKTLCVGLAQFFSALIEAHGRIVMKDSIYLRSWFMSYNREFVNYNDFCRLIKALDANAEPRHLFLEACSQKKVTCQAFCDVVIKHHIGGYGLRDFVRENIIVTKGKWSADAGEYYSFNSCGRSSPLFLNVISPSPSPRRASSPRRFSFHLPHKHFE